MKYVYDNQEFDVQLGDDGTLDTVVIVNGREYRFNEDRHNEDGSLSEETITSAIEAYLDDTEAR